MDDAAGIDPVVPSRWAGERRGKGDEQLNLLPVKVEVLPDTETGIVHIEAGDSLRVIPVADQLSDCIAGTTATVK